MTNLLKGYPKECLVFENQDYLCSICDGVFRSPVQTSCGHRFCKMCLNQLINDSNINNCPLCLLENNEINSFIEKEAIHDDRAFNKELSKCKVKCFHENCNWNGQYFDLENHLITCDYVTENCILCEQSIIRKSDHQCDLNTKCFLACTHNYTNKELSKLSLSICRHSLFLKSKIEKTFPMSVNKDALYSEISAHINTFLEMHFKDLAQKTKQIEELKVNAIELEKKVQSNESVIHDLERKIIISDAKIKDLEIRLNFTEQVSYDGTLIWQITDFKKKREDAINGRITSIYSNPFYSSKYGYKMSVRIYLNGDGMGKGTHISLFFMIMKGNFDALLIWPFRHQVKMYFLDQVNENHLMDAFKPDQTSSSFRQPTTEMNIASGCPMFMPLTKLTESGQNYIKNDTAYIKVVVNTNE